MEEQNERDAITRLTMSVEGLNKTMKEFKEDFREFRNTDIKLMRDEIQTLKDWKTQQTGAMNFLKTIWYFLGGVVIAYLVYQWKK